MAIRVREVLQVLTRQVEAAMECQVTEAGPNQGGVVRADWGLAEPTGTVGLTAAAGLLYLSRAIRPHEAPSEPSNEVVLDRMRLAADYLARVQRPSGRIDLRDCNYDSAPDAAFAVQALCPLIELGRPIRARSTAWDAVLRSVERFVRAALVGMLDGGFHTPNHRWVMAAAMTWAGRLFPDVDVQPVVRAYLAEGFDLNEDGAYTEQSAGLYDGICDRSLMLLHQYGGNSEALQAACANLTLNLHLLHPDGTIETGASRRQDRGQRPIPAALTLPYLMAYDVVQDSRFAEAADFLWARSGRRSRPHVVSPETRRRGGVLRPRVSVRLRAHVSRHRPLAVAAWGDQRHGVPRPDEPVSAHLWAGRAEGRKDKPELLRRGPVRGRRDAAGGFRLPAPL